MCNGSPVLRIVRLLVFVILPLLMFTGSFSRVFSQVRPMTATPPGSNDGTFNPNAFYPVPATAASINKGGDVSVNLASGAPSVGIPLFNVKSRFLALPVSLNYASNGIKVNEVPGVVGLGWSLNCGGVVNRTCFGLPDEERYGSLYPNNFTKTDQDIRNYDRAVLNYLNAETDRESDVFDFSVNGMISGKFIFGNDGKAIFLEDKNYKVTTMLANIRSGIEIIDEKGIRYLFKDCDTSSYIKRGAYCKEGPQSRVVKFGNAWYLSSIIQPGQDTITFSYTKRLQTYLVDASETESIVTGSELWACSDGSSGIGCAKYTNTYDNCFTEQTIDGRLLSRVDFNGGALVFDYASEYIKRLDINGGEALSYIRQLDSKGNELRNAEFIYKHFRASRLDNYLRNNGIIDTTLLYRLALDRLNITAGFDGAPPITKYAFSYLNGDQLPARLSGSQDYFGYYNGKDNSYLLTSVKDDYPGMDYYDLGYPARYGDRTPNTTLMQYGLLNKIVYPTGGYDTIMYDFNKVKEQYIDDHKATWGNSINGIGLSTTRSVEGTLQIPYTQTVNIDFKVTSSDPDKRNLRDSGAIYIFDGDGDPVYIQVYRPIQNSQPAVKRVLNPGTYTIRLLAQGEQLHSIVGIDYFSQIPDTLYRDRPLGGLSVVGITSKDHIANTTVRKKYSYIYKEDGRYSTFRIAEELKYMGGTRIPLFRLCGGNWDCSAQTYCSYLIHTNNMIKPASLLGSGPCYHVSVIETSTGTDSIDRSVEYRYKYNTIFTPGVMNGFITNTPYGIVPDYLIGDTLTTYYSYNPKLDINSRTMVQKVIKKTYEEGFTKIVDNFNVRKVYTSLCVFDPPQQSEFQAYHINYYPIMYQQKKLLSTEETEYPLNGSGFSRSLVTNTYNTPPYTLLKQRTTQSSKGDTLKTVFKYYWELNNNVLSDSMKNWNMIALPAEVATTTGGITQTKNTVDYKFQDNNSKIVQPYQYTTQLTGQALTKQYNIKKWDVNGHVQEVEKDGFLNSFLWDYNNCFMVAATVNAGVQSVAYTSFEAENDGGWTVTGSQRNRTDALTGAASYALSSGNITQSGLPAGVDYVISFWAKNGTVAVNGAAATVKAQRMGWTLYEYKFTAGTGSLIISGTAQIDELRLCPAAALMTTYTYVPLMGITSECDPQNKVTYYSYDALGRLMTVKDQDGKILKVYDYEYQVPAGQ